MTNESPDERLARLLKSGFKKEITFKYIKKDEKNRIICTEVDYYANKNPCYSCGSSAYRVLKPERTGVFLSCAWCKRTTGPLSKEGGVIRKSYEIAVDEAVEILKARNAPRRDIAEIIRARKPERASAEKLPRPAESA